ncbi:uncharacterized protein PG986_000497 [Apiospora aurea]|uniref:Uncharacterized protein n=1 Tax=Apiospora aurea TaxID=335848 RepID=A0ABR1QU63_9PEZI
MEGWAQPKGGKEFKRGRERWNYPTAVCVCVFAERVAKPRPSPPKRSKVLTSSAESRKGGDLEEDKFLARRAAVVRLKALLSWEGTREGRFFGQLNMYATLLGTTHSLRQAPTPAHATVEKIKHGPFCGVRVKPPVHRSTGQDASGRDLHTSQRPPGL